MLVDGGGEPVQANLYGAFGEVLRTWGDSRNDRLGNTKEHDRATGRYLSEDPLGYEGGFNLHVYWGNDPVNKFDPLGLKDEKPEYQWTVDDLERAFQIKYGKEFAGSVWNEVKGKTRLEKTNLWWSKSRTSRDGKLSDGKSLIEIDKDLSLEDAADQLKDQLEQSSRFFFDRKEAKFKRNPDYIKAMIELRLDAAKTGAKAATIAGECFIASATIVNEGADWVVTINDIAGGKADYSSLMALLPFVSAQAVKAGGKVIFSKGGKKIASEASSAEELANDLHKVTDGAKYSKWNVKKIVAETCHNHNATKMTLGRYERNPSGKGASKTSYNRVAKRRGVFYFDMGEKWDEYKTRLKLTDDQMFEIFNKPALDYAMQHNMAIRFTHDPLAKENIGKSIHKEYQYLLEHNYGTGLQEAKRGMGWELVR